MHILIFINDDSSIYVSPSQNTCESFVDLESGTGTLFFAVAVAFSCNCIHIWRTELLYVASKAVYELQHADP